VLSRQLGQAQLRCSAALAAQAAQVQALQAEVMRLRAAVMVRDTRLAMAQEALDELKTAAPSLPRRGALARQVAVLAERIAVLSRERLRWKLTAARHVLASDTPAGGGMATAPVTVAGGNPAALNLPGDAGLAAASLVICQTGCISHHDYWRVQDHCRRTGKACILVEHSLTALQAQVLESIAPATPSRRHAGDDEPVHGLEQAETKPV
jgi:hypothetical protein